MTLEEETRESSGPGYPRWAWIGITVLGALAYAGVSWLTNFMQLADALGVDLRPGIAIPIIMGFVYGPAVGFAVGFAGNALGDLASFHVFYWNWSLGNGLMGMVPSLRTGEALLLGDAVAMPTRVLIDLPEPQPHSADVPYHEAWTKGVEEMDVERVIKRWRTRRRDL